VKPEPPDLSASAETRSADAATQITGARVVGAGFWNVAARVLPQLYVLGIAVAAARVLGPDGMGQQSFISFVQVSVVLLFTGGLSASLMRYTAEVAGRGTPDVVPGLMAWAWRILAAGAVGGAALLLALGLPRGELEAAWILAAAGGGVAVLHAVPHAVLTGLQRWREASIVGLTTGAAGTVATVAVLLAGGGITGMFAVELAVTTANLLWVRRLTRRAIADVTTATVAPDPELRGRVRSYAVGAWLHLVLHLVVWRRSELFVLDWTSTDAQIAMYSVAFAVIAAAKQIPSALATTLVPAFATLHGAGERERIGRGFSRGVRLLAVPALPMTAGLVALGPLLVRTVFGGEYAEAGLPLVIMAAVFPLLPLNSMCGGVLQGLGRIRRILLASAVATVVDIGLALLLIPRYGATGAALANSGAQLTAVVVMVAATVRLLPGLTLHVRPLLANAIASAGSGAAAYAAGDAVGGPAGLGAGIVAGVLVYAAGAAALRVLSTEDARWLDAELGHRLGGGVGRLARAFGGVRG
jgi:O-antigen/teichoic acid export membrane protein